MSDSSLFDLDLDALDAAKQYPDWPEFSGRNGEIARTMYDRITTRFELIAAQLDRGIDLQGKDRKIIASTIAMDVGRNANYLTKREFPRLHEYIAFANKRLAKKKVIGKDTPKPKSRLSSLESAQRIEELEEQLKRLMFEPLIENAAISHLGIIRQKNIAFQAEVGELSERLVKARRTEASMTEQISELLTENSKLKQIILDLGGDPDPTSLLPMRRVK